MIFRSVSGAIGCCVLTGERILFSSFQPHSVSCKEFPVHPGTARYVLKECCLAAALVGGKPASWNDDASEVRLIPFCMQCSNMHLVKSTRWVHHRASAGMFHLLFVFHHDYWFNILSMSDSCFLWTKLNDLCLPWWYTAEMISHPLIACITIR